MFHLNVHISFCVTSISLWQCILLCDYMNYIELYGFVSIQHELCKSYSETRKAWKYFPESCSKRAKVFAQMMMASATKSCQTFMPTSFQSMMIPRSSHHGRRHLERSILCGVLLVTTTDTWPTDTKNLYLKFCNQSRPAFKGDPTSFSLAHLQADLKTAITLSGGGTRAMVAAIGALRAMEELSLMSHVDLMVSVSGGTWTAGPYMRLRLTAEDFVQPLQVLLEREKWLSSSSR